MDLQIIHRAGEMHGQGCESRDTISAVPLDRGVNKAGGYTLSLDTELLG